MNIELKNINLSFDEDNVLDDLNLTFQSSELSCLLGRSGSGKTSILKIIGGILKPDSGKVMFNGKDVTKIRTQDRNVGWVPQLQLIFPGLNVRENISYGLRARQVPREERERRTQEAVELVGLENLVDRDPAGLSGGERQRVALARAIAPDPDILLLDEPFSSLDAPERDRLSLSFRQVQLETGVTTIHVTHSPREAELLSDQVYILSDGDILQSGTIGTIQNNPISPEVVKLLNLSNFVESNEHMGIDTACIIPESAITLGEGEITATILSMTSNKVYLRVGSTIMEISEIFPSMKPGEEINLNIDRSQIMYLKPSE